MKGLQKPVGATGFEPVTLCSQIRGAAKFMTNEINKLETIAPVDITLILR